MDWDSIAQRTGGTYEPEDFERACYRLVTEQVIYRGDHGSATTYWLINSNERVVRDALDLVGVDLMVNRNLQYAVALPRHAGSTVVTTEETLVALVMRRYYDEQMRAGASTDDGEVLCDLEEFAELYRQMTQHELPGKGAFAAIFRSLKRWGIAREHDTEGEVSTGAGVIAIRPAIAEVLGEQALARLASLGKLPRDGTTPSESDDEEGQDHAA